jgi:hypothetical protein
MLGSPVPRLVWDQENSQVRILSFRQIENKLDLIDKYYSLYDSQISELVSIYGTNAGIIYLIRDTRPISTIRRRELEDRILEFIKFNKITELRNDKINIIIK